MQDFVNDIKGAVRAAKLKFPNPADLKMELPAELAAPRGTLLAALVKEQLRWRCLLPASS